MGEFVCRVADANGHVFSHVEAAGTLDEARQKLDKLRSMYEPYLHSMGKNLMLSLPPWKHPAKTRDNWQAGPWDRVIQARGLAILGQKVVTPVAGEDHF